MQRYNIFRNLQALSEKFFQHKEQTLASKNAQHQGVQQNKRLKRDLSSLFQKTSYTFP